MIEKFGLFDKWPMPRVRNYFKLAVGQFVTKILVIFDRCELIFITTDSETRDDNRRQTTHKVASIIRDPILIRNMRTTLSPDHIHFIDGLLRGTPRKTPTWIRWQQVFSVRCPACCFYNRWINTQARTSVD